MIFPVVKGKRGLVKRKWGWRMSHEIHTGVLAQSPVTNSLEFTNRQVWAPAPGKITRAQIRYSCTTLDNGHHHQPPCPIDFLPHQGSFHDLFHV